jgi:transposase
MSEKKFVVSLTEAEREELEVTSCKASGRKVKYALALLKADAGWSDEKIAEAYGLGLSTIARLRQRFVEEGMPAALNRRSSGRVYRKKIEGDEEAHLIALACSEPPKGRAYWTMQLLADKLIELKYVDSVSDETVRRVLKKTSSSPGRTRNGVSRHKPTPLLSARWKRS